jgi:hypothetical protein
MKNDPVWFDLTPFDAVAHAHGGAGKNLDKINAGCLAQAKSFFYAPEGYFDGFFRIQCGYGKAHRFYIEGRDQEKMRACWKALLLAVAAEVEP